MKRILIVGIDTGVGKTVVSTLFCQALRAAYWKPVQCGIPTDCEWVEKLGIRCYPSSIVLKEPCSPHLAARLEGVGIEAKELKPPEHSGALIIEGTGGLLAPLNENEAWIDAALHWGGEWVLVHRHYLGSLNHFLLTVEAMRHRGIPLRGVVFNGKGDPATEEMLLKRAGAACLARVPWIKTGF